MGIDRPYQIYPTPTGLPRGRRAQRRSIPPPIGGWNTRDDPAQMRMTDATQLINWYPRLRDVVVRNGYISHATGVGSTNVDTVVEFFDGTTRRLLACSPTNIYNATSSGAASSLAGSLNSGRWQTDMMDGIMGLVNGVDVPKTYNGSTISNMTISGPTIANLIGIKIFKSRSYFWESGKQSFWYSSTNALGGTLTEFALGEIAEKGGFLMAMENWTVDGGSGADDFAVFIMSSGEVLVYQGSDPGDSSDWSKVGSYVIPAPLDIRAVSKIGSQILVATTSDLVYLPSAFDKASPPPTKLSGALQLAGPTYKSNTGWQLIYYPKRTMMILNVPIRTDEFEQYVINTSNGSPARFIDQPSRSWGIYNDDLYFGSTDGVVYQADTGTHDDSTNINSDARQAWTDLGSPEEKVVTSFRGVFSGTSIFKPGMEMGYDFTNADVTRVVTTGGSGTAWGSPWGSAWGSTQIIRDEWQLAEGSGTVVSPQVSLGTQDETPIWYRTDLLVEAGGNI